MNKVVRYKAKDPKKGMTPGEVRAALNDAEADGTVVILKAVVGFGGRIWSLDIETVMEDKGAQA